MAYLFRLVFAVALLWPSWVFAEEVHDGGYRGIATIYYTLIWVILAYGLLDAFGRKALYVGAPVLAVIIYFLLPPS